MKRPPVPLTRHNMRGIPIPFMYPSWVYKEDFYSTPCGVYVSLDGTKTHPKKLTTSQQHAVALLRERREYYAGR
jgi:hypothetical protein